jgi:methylphosphotriester-DNA--protein-cysteine methyltransferase
LRRLGLSKFIQIFDKEVDALKAFDVAIDEFMSRGALGEYVSAATTRSYHLSYCPAAQKISENERIYYQSKLHAREAGRKPCKRCRP